jgi:outer membrane protein TolC
MLRPLLPPRVLTLVGALAILGVALAAVLAAAPVAAQPVAALPDSLVTGDTARIGLAGALARAVRISPDVQERRAVLRSAKGRRSLARASRFATEFELNTAHTYAPTLNIPEDNTRPPTDLYLNPDVRNDWARPVPFNSIDARLLQPIWTWGELGGNIRAAEHGVDVEAAAVDRQALTAAARTGELYYNVLLTDALHRLARETGDVVERAKREVKRLLDEGAEDVEDADLFQVQLTEEEYRRRLVEVTQRRRLARTALRRQLFLPDDVALRLRDEELTPLAFPLPPDSLAFFLALAQQRRPELAQAQAGIAARAALVDVAESDFYPKLGVQLTYGYRYTPQRFNQRNPYVGDPLLGNSTRSGLGLRQNLNFFQTRARVEQAEADLQRVRYQEEGAQQLIRVEVERAFREVVLTEAAYQSRDRALTTTGEWLRTEQINFDLGFGDTENLINAVRANLQAEASYYQAVHAYNLAVLDLLRAAGVLVERAQAGMLMMTER